MSREIKHRRGTTAQHEAFVGAAGEFTWDITKKTIVGHDGAQLGGFPLARQSAVDGVAADVANQAGDITELMALRDYVYARKRSACRLTLASPTGSIFTNNTEVNMTWATATVIYDINNWWDVATPENFYVPNLPGLVGFSFSIVLNGSGVLGANAEVNLTKNGSSVFGMRLTKDCTVHANIGPFAFAQIPAVANDIIRWRLYNTSGVSRAVSSGDVSIEAVFNPET